MFRCNTIYEGEYLLGTSIARPLIAKRQIEIAKKEKANELNIEIISEAEFINRFLDSSENGMLLDKTQE